MYEAPCNDSPEAQRAWGQYIEQLTEALAANRHGDAVAPFMRYAGTPAEQIEACGVRLSGRVCRLSRLSWRSSLLHDVLASGRSLLPWLPGPGSCGSYSPVTWIRSPAMLRRHSGSSSGW